MTKEEAIAKLEQYRRASRAEKWMNKWDEMPKDQFEKLYKRARQLSTPNLIMMCTDKNGIRPEFRHSPWVGVLADRISRMSETELDEAEARAIAHEIADDPIIRPRR